LLDSHAIVASNACRSAGNCAPQESRQEVPAPPQFERQLLKAEMLLLPKALSSLQQFCLRQTSPGSSSLCTIHAAQSDTAFFWDSHAFGGIWSPAFPLPVHKKTPAST
jgi:hypothetical protein